MCARSMSWPPPHAKLPKHVALRDLPRLRFAPLGALLLDVERSPRANTAAGVLEFAHDVIRDRRANAGAALATRN